MSESELIQTPSRPKRQHFEWVLPIFIKPAKTLDSIAKHENGAWQTPLLILSVLVIILVLVGGPIRAQSAQMGGELPPDFQYWPQEQQDQYFASQANQVSPLFIYIFPAAGALIGLWVTWFILGSILHLILTLSGSRSSNTASLNLVAWASMPFAVRYLVQIIAVLITRQLISAPGLSGFMAAEGSGGMAFLRAFLALVDIYLIWQIALLLIGVLPLSGLNRGKAWLVTLLAVLIILSLQALPGLLGSVLSGLSITRPFFF